MRVAFVQTSPRLGETRRNLEEAYSLIEKVRDADLVVLPELFHSGYAVRDRDEAENLSVVSGEPCEPIQMCLDASRNFRLSIVAGFLERTDTKILYNSAWLIGTEGVEGVYRKVHLFDEELEIFSPGDDDSPVLKVGKARVGMQVCFDWIFPEPWGRLAWGENGKNGAQIIAHPANLVLPDKCPTTIRARAIENRIFVITAGRVGADPGSHGDIIFMAGSRIVAPDGSVLACGAEDRSDCDMVTINPELADDKFLTPKNNVLKERFGSREEQHT